MTRIRLSREFVAEGFHHDELTQMTRRKELVHIRRGAYVEPSSEEPDPRAAHRQLVEATIRQSSPEAVASYVSAAVLHGLPTWNDSLSRVHLSRNRSGGGRRRRRYSEIHGATLPERDVVLVDGIRTTSLGRTVVDLACALPMDRAAAAGDAALRLGADPAELTELLDEGGGRRGIAQARRAVAFLDGRSESAGESVSRVQFHRYGIPKPDLQHDVFGPEVSSSVARTSGGSSTTRLASSTARSSTAARSNPIKRWRMCCSTRSTERMPCATRICRSCAGSGKTSIHR